MSLLVTLETRIRQALERERRAKFERETLLAEARRLRNGEDAGIVLARLASKGLMVTERTEYADHRER